MFDFLKNRPTDVKGIRHALVQFIKEQLQKAEGGEGANIKGIKVYVSAGEAQKHLYEAALYMEEENRFKEEEVQKIIDDYALELPADWTFEVSFVTVPPAGAMQAPGVDASVFISSRSRPAIHTNAKATLKILNGEAEKDQYAIDSSAGKINIGRDKKAKMADGFYRENHIAFLADSANESNRSVSRQHAHIAWNAHEGFFYLYADEGGIPPMNKTKIKKADGSIEKIQALEIGHRLHPGDQIMLGESAVLEFLE